MTDWLLGTLVATCALMALVLLIREPIRRQFGPRVVYALWLLPAARMILPSFTRTVERVAQPGEMSGLAATVTTFPAGRQEAAASTFAALPGGWSTLVIALWLVGAAVMLARGLCVYAVQRRAILGEGVQLARIGGIRLIRSEHVRGPLAFGLIDRVIIVPFDFDNRFSERQRCLALDHELAHHRSGDLAANIVAFVLLCLQWFNPLAWIAHAAFRFDQEAACDARVLDKAESGDRSAYGEAIAKAASGRTVLFAGALDRPSTLSRRLTIMTDIATARRRKLGFLLVGGGMLLGLPLTATSAVTYVDVQGPAPLAAPTAQAQPAARLDAGATAPAALSPPVKAQRASATAAAAPLQVNQDGSMTLAGGVTLDKGSLAFFDDDRVFLHGQVKRLEQLTGAERAEVRAAIAKSRRAIAREREQLPRHLAAARRELERIRSGAYRLELLEDREDLRRDLAEIDSEAAELRASGEDPEKLKAEIRKALRQAEAVDIAKEIRQALEESDPDKIVAELRNDEAQMARMEARLDQLGPSTD